MSRRRTSTPADSTLRWRKHQEKMRALERGDFFYQQQMTRSLVRQMVAKGTLDPKKSTSEKAISEVMLRLCAERLSEYQTLFDSNDQNKNNCTSETE
ncbi:hypothetical protein [Thalassobaculum litoreum]|uniref:hypothetical protein n=1 Tax=Thalassobaculum litoreum TaxID=420996 RepID=UPI0011142922|nr:hypothetical protein [Thalassobaculum litoreum]